MAPTGRFLLLRLADPLSDHRQTLAGVYALAMAIPGVLDVNDLALVSQATLDAWCYPAEETWEVKPKPRRKRGAA